ncbi:hypothetical protein Bca4012_028629 [Brassica carinata]
MEMYCPMKIVKDVFEAKTLDFLFTNSSETVSQSIESDQDLNPESLEDSQSSGFFFRWLFEARVSATKICKAAREWSQSIGVAPRASRFLPRRGLMFHQRLQIHVALRPGLVSAFP